MTSESIFQFEIIYVVCQEYVMTIMIICLTRIVMPRLGHYIYFLIESLVACMSIKFSIVNCLIYIFP